MKQVKITKAFTGIYSITDKYSVYYITDKYFTNGDFFLRKELVNYTNLKEVRNVGSSMEQVLEQYLYSKTPCNHCIINSRKINIDDFKYVDSSYSKKYPVYYIADKFYKEFITKKENRYTEEETTNFEETFGINSLYLDKIVKALNLNMVEVIAEQESDLEFEHRNSYLGYYKLYLGEELVGVIMGCEKCVNNKEEFYNRVDKIEV